MRKATSRMGRYPSFESLAKIVTPQYGYGMHREYYEESVRLLSAAEYHLGSQLGEWSSARQLHQRLSLPKPLVVDFELIGQDF